MGVTAITSGEIVILLPYAVKRPVCSILINDVEYKTKLLDFNCKRRSHQSPSSIKLSISNFSQQYTTTFSKGHIIKLYCDYSTGTTKIFEGKIHKINPSNNPDKIILSASDYGIEAMSRNVNRKYENKTISYIFNDLISTYLSTHTTTNVETNSTIISIAFSGRKLWNCLQELVERTRNIWTFYCDFDKDWHFFNKTTKTNTGEAFSYQRNLFRINPNESLSDVKNKITIFGSFKKGLPLFYTADTGYGDDAEDIIIKDSNLTTLDMIKDKADELKLLSASSEIKGNGFALGSPNLNPSDKVYIFAPYQNLQGWYIISKFSHILSQNRFRTSFDFQEEGSELDTVESFLKNRIIVEQQLSDIYNEFEMDYSIVMDFEDSTYIGSSSSNVESLQSYLQLESGQSSGTFISTSYEANSNVSKFVLRVMGDATPDILYYVSVDNGISYQLVNPDTEYSTTSEGKNIIIKATFSDSTQKISAIGIEYE